MLTSREFKVAGAIGPCSSLRKLGGNVAETAIGEGGTNAWSLGGVDPSVTLAVYFEVTNAANNPLPPTKRRYLQFLTSYQHASGAFRLRCTTVAGQFSVSQSLSFSVSHSVTCLVQQLTHPPSHHITPNTLSLSHTHTHQARGTTTRTTWAPWRALSTRRRPACS